MDPKVRPDTLSLVTKGAKFLSTLAVGPIGLLAPFIHLGAHKKHPCDIQGIGQLGLNIPASRIGRHLCSLGDAETVWAIKIQFKLRNFIF